MEALACGKPVATSKVGGIPDILNEKNGYLVKPRDIKQLAEGIEKSLQHSWDPK